MKTRVPPRSLALACIAIVGSSEASDFPLYWVGPKGWVSPQGEIFRGAAGDVDGDGMADVLLLSSDQPTASSPQQAIVRSGLNGSVLRTRTPSVPTLFGFQGNNDLEPAGDLNLDGYGDVALSIMTPIPPLAAMIEIRSGLDASVLALLPPPPGSNASLIGFSIAGAGDLDGDGMPELLAAGFHQVSVPGCISFGQGVYDFEAPGFGVQYTQTSWQCSQLFGVQLGRVDDVDGDGNPDFYIGAAWTDVAGAGIEAGWIGIFSGATGTLITSLNGTAPSQHLGASLAALGDVTGDGLPEIAALRSTPTFTGSFGSSISILSLPTFTTINTLTAASMGASWIRRIDALGDSDGDGLGDFLAEWSDPLNSETVTAFSGTTGAPIGQVFQGYPVGVLYPISGLGDVNGDGLGDFATTPWTQNTILPPFAAQGLWSPWSWPITDGAAHVYVSPNLRISGAPAVGGSLTLQVVVPKHPGRPFQVVFAQDYASPGIPLGPFLFPLVPDALFWTTLGAGFGGTLGATGQGSISIAVPNDPGLHGVWAIASGAVFDPAGPLGIGCILTQAGFQIP